MSFRFCTKNGLGTGIYGMALAKLWGTQLCCTGCKKPKNDHFHYLESIIHRDGYPYDRSVVIMGKYFCSIQS